MSFGNQLDIDGGETPHEHVVKQVDPEFNPDYVMGPGDDSPRPATADEREALGLPAVHPGDTCELCLRRVPFPKKSSSPNTRPLAYRIPLDEYDAHVETIDAVAELLGIKETKYHRFNTVNAGLVALLQGARLEETGE